MFKCKACRHQTSVTAGTVLHRTRVPLTLWFGAAYLVSTHTPGISARQLQRQLGLSRYETAWTLLQRLRAAMVRPQRDSIPGPVEVDETYVGGLEVGRRGGRWRDGEKAIVVGAVEVRGQGSGRVVLLPSTVATPPYLVLTKPLRLDIQCQRGASVKIGWKYLDD